MLFSVFIQKYISLNTFAKSAVTCCIFPTVTKERNMGKCIYGRKKMKIVRERKKCIYGLKVVKTNYNTNEKRLKGFLQEKKIKKIIAKEQNRSSSHLQSAPSPTCHQSHFLALNLEFGFYNLLKI